MSHEFFNTFLILGVLMVMIWLLVFIMGRSQSWTGPAIAARQKASEDAIAYNSLRIKAVEENTGIQYRDLEESIKSLRTEIRGIAVQWNAVPLLAHRVSTLEDQRADIEQELQFFRDLGCGHPACPRKEKDKEKDNA